MIAIGDQDMLPIAVAKILIRRQDTPMNRWAFANLLRKAILGAWDEFIAEHAADDPYAFALIGGQCANYLGYAIATESGLQSVAAKYEDLGYRYQGGEEHDRQKLASWLRWGNPCDGWLYGNFPDRFQVQAGLAQLVEAGGLGADAEDFEEFCTEVLASLTRAREWKPWRERVAVGFTWGENPWDFLRSATRSNLYRLVQKVWGEYWQAEEFSGRIQAPK